jgi:hypothetical protein
MSLICEAFLPFSEDSEIIDDQDQSVSRGRQASAMSNLLFKHHRSWRTWAGQPNAGTTTRDATIDSLAVLRICSEQRERDAPKAPSASTPKKASDQEGEGEHETAAGDRRLGAPRHGPGVSAQHVEVRRPSRRFAGGDVQGLDQAVTWSTSTPRSARSSSMSRYDSPEPQVPADRRDDDVGWELEAGKRRHGAAAGRGRRALTVGSVAAQTRPWRMHQS